MGYEANARTDERGHRLVGQFPGNMKSQPLVEHRKDPWKESPTLMKSSRIGDLLNKNSQFHLIGTYLVNEKHLSATTMCRAGKAGTIRVVIVAGREYRSDAYQMYERNQAT